MSDQKAVSEGLGVERLLRDTPYHALRRLGRGAMGEVYAIEHTFLRAQFALKVLHPELARDPQSVDRMRVEAQAAARLRHPNVVEVIDFWITADGEPCLVMELLKGHALRTELATRGRLPLAEALHVALQALSALAAAHAVGVVHRDIKPENLFLHEQAGAGRILKVLDFGVARVLPDATVRAPRPLNSATVTGTQIGSPRYMSPEGLRGEHVDRRADVFAMGLVLYVMLVGHGPVAGEGVLPEAPSEHVAELPAEIDAIVLRALAPEPDQRYANAGEFLMDIQAAAGTTGAPVPMHRWMR